MAKKTKKVKKNKKVKSKGSRGLTVWIFIFAAILMSIVFLASTILLFVGMLPTLIAAVVVSKNHKNKALTIGAMNFAGCFAYLLSIWQSNDRMGTVLEILSNPMTVVIMYGAAGIGYIINWGVTNFVRQMMYSGAERKIKNIEKEKLNLIERWGKKVKGEIVLDINGFPVLTSKEKKEAELDNQKET